MRKWLSILGRRFRIGEELAPRLIAECKKTLSEITFDLEYVVFPEGQAVLTEMGYVPHL